MERQDYSNVLETNGCQVLKVFSHRGAVFWDAYNCISVIVSQVFSQDTFSYLPLRYLSCIYEEESHFGDF